MIVIDTSFMVALVRNENQSRPVLYGRLLACAELTMSAATLYETRVVLFNKTADQRLLGALDEVLASISIEVRAFDENQAELASQAYQRYGKGHHPAGLNLGDCPAYALAKSLDAPLLFTGNDFSKTDVMVAP